MKSLTRSHDSGDLSLRSSEIEPLVGYGEKEKLKMRRTFGILFVVALMLVMTGSLFAQGMMKGMCKGMGKEKGEIEVEVKKVVGTQGMMGGGMCPMCKQMMGDSGMMSGGMAPMMQGMMGGSGMMDMKPHIAGMAEVLKLSEEQQSKLEALHIAHKKNMIRKKADKEIAEIDLQGLIQQDEPDLEAVEGQIREIANLEAAMKFAWVKLLVDSKSLLSAEQKEEFKKLMKGKKSQMMTGQMMGCKKAEANEPAHKDMPGEHEEHHQ